MLQACVRCMALVSEAVILSGLAEQALEYPFRTRLTALEHDLLELNLAPLPLSAALPAEVVPPASEDAALLGYLYVIEGSKLGARMLGRQIASTLPTAPRRFFSAASDPSSWADFCAYADARCPPARQAEAVKAALTMFDFFRAHLDACILSIAAEASQVGQAPGALAVGQTA